MNFETRPYRIFPAAAFAAAALGLALQAGPARAEDPLLGLIKVIKCVGCDPGAVNLVVHDPIDVRDFEVQIKESDYQKIITPLPGKTVYDKEGCFYWMEMPKPAKPPAGKDGAKDSAKARDGKSAGKAPGVPPSGDSARDSSASAAVAAPQGTPSRCIPYVRIEPKPTHSGGKKNKD